MRDGTRAECYGVDVDGRIVSKSDLRIVILRYWFEVESFTDIDRGVRVRIAPRKAPPVAGDEVIAKIEERFDSLRSTIDTLKSIGMVFELVLVGVPGRAQSDGSPYR